MRFMPYQDCEEALIRSWIRSEKEYYQWSAGVLGEYPMAPGRLNAFYREWKSGQKYMVFCACDEALKPMGHLIMRYPDGDPRHLRFGFVLVDPARRGEGVGRRMLGMAIAYARDFLKAETICLGVTTDNPGARHLYESLGFCDTGEREEVNCGEILLYEELQLELRND
ncbi:MAG: GNAT family N-acetyltransferase [Oscillospiraceae bacterium]|nr:GNAT family N-acetyltransferase [Oscillospiraceae bacterium]